NEIPAGMELLLDRQIEMAAGVLEVDLADVDGSQGFEGLRHRGVPVAGAAIITQRPASYQSHRSDPICVARHQIEKNSGGRLELSRSLFKRLNVGGHPASTAMSD